MGWWLKCPGCQAHIPLSARACPQCSRDLDNLPPDQRIYVIGPPGAFASKPPASEPKPRKAPTPPSPPSGQEEKHLKKPKKPKKKKEQEKEKD